LISTEYGVDRASAEERIAALSDQEARTLAAEVANAPLVRD